AEFREGHRGPDRGVGVLAAVLAHAGQVALDVAGVERGLVERRIEQLHQAGVAVHQVAVQRGHRLALALGLTGAAEHRPALRDGVDAAFLVGVGTQRRTVVEVRAAVPGAVPGVLLQRGAQRGDPGAAALGERGVAAPRGEFGEVGQQRAFEPAQPYAFADAALAHAVHAVVPAPAADQRRAVRAARGEAAFDRAHTVAVQRLGQRRVLRQVVVRLLVVVQRAALDVADDFVQHRAVAAGQ